MANGTAVLEPVTAEPSETTPLLSSFAARADLPSWFVEQQRAAWEEFQKLPAPNRKDQAWRFSNVDALNLADFKVSAPLSEDDHRNVSKHSRGLDEVAGRMIFANDQLVDRIVFSDRLKTRGVIFLPLEQAVSEHPDLVRQHFMSQPATLGSAKYAALHRAMVSSGTFLFVPRGVEIEEPIEIFHWLRGHSVSMFPHLLLVAGENSKVTVIERFLSCDRDARGFACGVNDLIVGQGANVSYVCAQGLSEKAVALQMNTTTVERDGNGLSLNLNLGGAYARFESLSRLVGAGARSDLLAVAVAHGKQEFDARTLQDHIAPQTKSDLLYKNALSDQARTTVGGLIRVEPQAHFTDAYQTVRNLLLSDEAEANSMPGLEILADNVKCSHGATSGQVNEEELFYLLARGIPKKVAQQLIVTGFLGEVLQRLPNKTIANELRESIAGKFRRDAWRAAA